ncbi:2-amino-4-hydroxy-6-hydroxymethyldihydropteridinepyrophosphokinase (EC [Olavius algarvensis Delta 1 endosymbiont]|nr:2-amino-4-hydroxy-6-hydroxymethyldihydropteridinepyrophosphokinase (EC [Olavius algarvensis Delta 1 endosymbiont]
MNPDSHLAYLSVGSNLGNKLENCRNGIADLARSPDVRLIDQSPVYRTEPVDYLDQGWFVNYAVKIETTLEPHALLDLLKSIEQAVGRVPHGVRFGPRVLDLDIILYDDVVQNDAGLTIPHPRMHKRRFVLKPICDIDPDINHPVLQQTMRDLLDNLAEEGQEIVEYK